MPRKRTHEQRYHTLMKTAATYRPHKYQAKYVQRVFNRMIRAEAGAFVGIVPAVVEGVIETQVISPLGYCVCVTCGELHPWNLETHKGGRLDSGHFLTGQRISLIESNCHPQCANCNNWESGHAAYYRIYIEYVYGKGEVDRLLQLKNLKTYEPPTREWLVAKRIEFEDRLDAAVEKMK